MNKKGQYGLQEDKYANINPVLLIGIFMLVGSYMIEIFSDGTYGWLKVISIIIILLGAGLTIMENV